MSVCFVVYHTIIYTAILIRLCGRMSLAWNELNREFRSTDFVWYSFFLYVARTLAIAGILQYDDIENKKRGKRKQNTTDCLNVILIESSSLRKKKQTSNRSSKFPTVLCFIIDDILKSSGNEWPSEQVRREVLFIVPFSSLNASNVYGSVCNCKHSICNFLIHFSYILFHDLPFFYFPRKNRTNNFF